MNPPPIGEALSVGWETFKKNMAPIIIAMVCALIAGIIPGVGTAGMLHVGLKALRGQVPEPSDGFIGFKQLVDNLVMGLLQIVGVIACCLGVYVTFAIFMPGSALIAEKGMSWADAKDRCLAEVKPNWVPWTIFTFVVMFVGGLGSILCGIGIVVTLPVAMIAMAYAYDKTFLKA